MSEQHNKQGDELEQSTPQPSSAWEQVAQELEAASARCSVSHDEAFVAKNKGAIPWWAGKRDAYAAAASLVRARRPVVSREALVDVLRATARDVCEETPSRHDIDAMADAIHALIGTPAPVVTPEMVERGARGIHASFRTEETWGDLHPGEREQAIAEAHACLTAALGTPAPELTDETVRELLYGAGGPPDDAQPSSDDAWLAEADLATRAQAPFAQPASEPVLMKRVPSHAPKLPRPLTDAEWEHVQAYVREKYGQPASEPRGEVGDEAIERAESFARAKWDDWHDANSFRLIARDIAQFAESEMDRPAQPQRVTAMTFFADAPGESPQRHGDRFRTDSTVAQVATNSKQDVRAAQVAPRAELEQWRDERLCKAARVQLDATSERDRAVTRAEAAERERDALRTERDQLAERVARLESETAVVAQIQREWAGLVDRADAADAKLRELDATGKRAEPSHAAVTRAQFEGLRKCLWSLLEAVNWANNHACYDDDVHDNPEHDRTRATVKRELSANRMLLDALGKDGAK